MQPHKLPTPRADGDREGLRILLSARRDLTVARTAQINRLRALLLGGDEADRALAKGRLSDQWLGHIARRRGRAGCTREQAIRLGEARRLAVAIRAAGAELVTNKAPAADPGEHPRAATAGQDSVSGRSAQHRHWCRSPIEVAAATTRHSPRWPAPARSRPAAGASKDTDSTVAVTER